MKILQTILVDGNSTSLLHDSVRYRCIFDNKERDIIVNNKGALYFDEIKSYNEITILKTMKDFLKALNDFYLENNSFNAIRIYVSITLVEGFIWRRVNGDKPRGGVLLTSEEAEFIMENPEKLKEIIKSKPIIY